MPEALKNKQKTPLKWLLNIIVLIIAICFEFFTLPSAMFCFTIHNGNALVMIPCAVIIGGFPLIIAFLIIAGPTLISLKWKQWLKMIIIIILSVFIILKLQLYMYIL